MKEEQLKLFKMPKRLYRKVKSPLYYVEIMEKGGEKYILWIRTFNLCDVKKLAKIEYNDKRGYDLENDLKFGKIKEIEKGRKDKMKKEKEMTESEKKKCGCYFNPKAEIQRKEIIKNLNKTSENEKLMRLKQKERR